jgi:hypothetical protein
MKTKIQLISFLVFFSLSFFFSVNVYTQPNPGSGPVHPPPPTTAPIDGGLSILLVLAAGFGAIKTFKARKKKSED